MSKKEEVQETLIVEGEAENGQPSISKISKNGYKLLKENKIDKAIDCFMSILQIEDNNNYALVGMGDAERKKGAFKNAINYYKKCLDFHPDNNYALFGLADCYKFMNKHQKVIDTWKQYLVHDEKNITVLTRIADAYRKIRDYKNSRAVYLKVLEIEDNNPFAIIGLGHLNYDFKEYSNALLYWEKMLDTDIEKIDIRVLTSIGNCHRKLKTFSKGIYFFEQAISKEPNNFYAAFGLADCYRGLNQQEKSLEYWKIILKQDPRNKVIITRAGDAYRSMENYEKAQEYYEHALNIEYDTYAVLGLALIAKIQGKFDEAIRSLHRLKEQEPKSYRIYIELADCYEKINEKHKAIETLEEFTRLGIRNAKVTEMLERL